MGGKSFVVQSNVKENLRKIYGFEYTVELQGCEFSAQ
jgi:hypothetical protein